jgi:hypothetical protein
VAGGGLCLSHPFHALIRETVARAALPECEVVRDAACGGTGYVPIFSMPTWSDESKHAQVDILVLRADRSGRRKVRMIIEIERSGLTPVKIIGKFVTSAAASYFMPEPGASSVEFDGSTVFVQVLDTSRLNIEKTTKPQQFDALEHAIGSLLPLSPGPRCALQGVLRHRGRLPREARRGPRRVPPTCPQRLPTGDRLDQDRGPAGARGPPAGHPDSHRACGRALV